MDQALEELIGFQVGSRVLTGREVKPHAPNRRPPPPPPPPPPPQHPQGYPLSQGWGPEADRCCCRPSCEVVGPDTLTELPVPRPASLLLLTLAWIPGGLDLSRLGQQARECVCMSKVGVIPGPGLVSNLMWSLWPGRVINAGKSRHNEDQACCEVVYVEGRRSVSGAPREPSPGQVSPQRPARPPETGWHLCPAILGICF